ncbi:MAG: homocysteine S-methyltransferase family protein, partial [Anaerolineae bacterium]|nr:homocysteine S-methyltransferase family protein [Anaerolineae bacterium]
MATLNESIQRGEIIIIDGGVSTEIQRRGAAMDQVVWSGIVHMTHPDIALAVHEDYIRAGARVITTNTFSGARHVLENINLKGEVESINKAAVELAHRARDNAATDEVWIAGSMSSMPPLNSLRDTVRHQGVAAGYQEQAEILAEMGVDLIVAEMMTDPVNAPMVVKAALSTGLPVWVGFSAMSADEGLTVVSQRTDPEFDTRPPDDFA